MALKLISDEETRHLKTEATSVLDIRPGDGAFFKAEFLKRRRWAAVIFEGDFHDIDGRVSSHVRADASGKTYCIGLAEYMQDAYAIEPKHEDFSEVRRKYVEPSYLISDRFESFAIVSDSDYYWTIASDRDRLTKLFAASVPDYLDEFEFDISAYLNSVEKNDNKIGHMLSDYLGICRVSCARVGLLNAKIPEPIDT